jgi:hypothetical protein
MNTIKGLSIITVTCLVLISTIINAQEQAIKKQSLHNDAVVNSLIKTLSNYYILSDKGEKMIKVLRRQMNAGVYALVVDPNELATKLEKDLKSIYEDRHLHIYFDPEFVRSQAANVNIQQKKKELDDELAYERAHNFMFISAKVLPRNIGYVQINGFTNFVEVAERTAYAAFSFLMHTDAIVLDLRFNGGGSPEMVGQVESYFFKARTHMSDIHERSNNKTKSFYTDPAKTRGITLDMPVYILTSKRTFSAGEDFSYSMQQVKRAQIVGDTTAGGAHPTSSYALADGFVADVPNAQSINPYSKQNWEGTGVLPDLPVSSSRALEKALEIIYRQQLAVSSNDKQKRSIQWQINALNASSDTYIGTQELSKFCGEYEGGLTIFLKNGALYCNNAERDHDVYKLIPLNPKLFMLDENVQVEFMDQERNNSKLRMHFIDGNVRDKMKL